MVGNFIRRWINKLRTQQHFTVEFPQLPSVEVKHDQFSVVHDAEIPVNKLGSNKRNAADQLRLISIQEVMRCRPREMTINDTEMEKTIISTKVKVTMIDK